MNELLLEVKNLKKYFPVTQGILFKKVKAHVHAVDGISFHMANNETFCLVGETGSGKTTTAKLIVQLLEPTTGEINFEGINLASLTYEQLRQLRRRMGMIFQDPFSSLDPRKSVANIIGEPIAIHKVLEKEEKSEKIMQLLEEVGLAPEHANRYPHEFSGGQRQRIAIARALSLNPSLVIADEPVSALDVSVQAQILNLMQDLQDEYGLAYLFITHDLSVVKHIGHRVGVMYAGKLLEVAPTKELFDNPLHSYTEALLSAIPIPDPEIMAERKRVVLRGEIPSPLTPPSGCRFHTRCPNARKECMDREPGLIEISEKHWVACHTHAS